MERLITTSIFAIKFEVLLDVYEDEIDLLKISVLGSDADIHELLDNNVAEQIKQSAISKMNYDDIFDAA